jgi:GH25 family lysozyme M1 (1,4-beta-N-acetylmuramidase)
VVESQDVKHSICTRCGTENPGGNKFCGQCGAPLDSVSTSVAAYLDANLKGRIDEIIKDRFRDKEIVETRLAAGVAEKLSGWGKLYGLYVGLPLVAATAYLAWLGFDVSKALNTLQETIAAATKRAGEVTANVDRTRERAEQLSKASVELDRQIKTNTALLAQIPKLAASVSQLSDRVVSGGAEQTRAFKKQGNAIGVDLSHHDSAVDSGKLKSAGVSFAYVKATQGATFVDKSFSQRCSQLKAAGLLCGGYHFLTGGEIQAQADSFIAQLQRTSTALPPVVDFEPNPTGKTASLEELRLFIELVAKRTGCTPVIYGGRNLRELAGGDPNLKSNPLWLAQFTNQPRVPGPWVDWTFWQFADNVSIESLPTYSYSVFNGTVDELRRFAKTSCPISAGK